MTMRRSIQAVTAVAILIPAPATSPAQHPAGETRSAVDFLVDAVQSLCRAEGDKLELAQHLIAHGWRLTDRADHYDRDFGVDAPVPLQNQHERGWRGPVTDGAASLIVNTTDYRDPVHRDSFSAMFMASPETAIDLEVFQRRIGMTLRPSAPPHVGRPMSFRPVMIDGRPGPIVPPRFGQMQHFTLEPAPPGIEIEATRTWGLGFPEQWFRVSCRTRFETRGD
ncbi:MAG: hypothetical protein ACLGHC_09095 [Alphaproteobacteria bacterium]